MFDWSDLRHFLAVARHGSTLAAARALRVNQSTVHRRLAALERQLDCQLVKRHPTGYRLTELGEELRGYAERVEDAVVAFERRVSASSKEIKGTVRVACPEAVGARLMMSPLIDRFTTRNPALQVEFVMGERILDLGKGEADIAIRAQAPADDKLFGRKIADAPWAIYASSAYLRRHGRIEREEDINSHPIIIFSGELCDHPSAQWLKSVAPRANVAARGTSLSALVLAAKSDAGLAALPVIVGEGEKNLVRVLGPLRDLATPFFLLMHQDMRRTPRVRVLFDFMIQQLPALRPLLSGTVR
jgi:DNA-binding transcriptional LysR family regulator